MNFDRFDIVEAYWCFYAEWHAGGLTDRDRAQPGRRSIAQQLHVMQFKPRPNLSSDTLTENGLEIYVNLVETWT